MLKVLMLDLGDTLVRDGCVLPHVPEALEALAQFVTADGDPLEVSLVSDFRMPPEPVTNEAVAEIFDEYVRLLDTFGLTSFFEPVDERVTLSTHAGAVKPDRRVFELALERLGVDAALENCLFVTEDGCHIQACRALGMAALQFGVSVQTPGVDFDDWAQLPELVAERLSSTDDTNALAALACRIAAEQGVQQVSIDRRTPDGLVEASASAWCPLSDAQLGELDGISVQLPVKFKLRVGHQGDVEAVDRESPTAEAKAEAAHFVKTLVANRQVAMDPGAAAPGTTHVIATDDRGRRVLKRKRFSTR